MAVEMIDAWEAAVRRDGMPVVFVSVLVDGAPVLLSMPADTLEWRAAEYGIDPDTGFAELLELAVAESFVPSDAAHPEFVYNTDSATARASQQRRCREKVRLTESALKRVNARGLVEARAPGEPKPSEKIRALMHLDPVVVAAKATQVERVRRRRRERTEPSRLTRAQRLERVQKATLRAERQAP